MKLRHLYQGRRTVFILESVEAEVKKLDQKPRIALLRMLENYAGGSSLPPQQKKFEERLPDGNGGQLAVYALRYGQVRLYVAEEDVSGTATVVCSEIDPKKKQRKAKRGKLERAAIYARQAFEFIRNQEQEES